MCGEGGCATSRVRRGEKVNGEGGLGHGGLQEEGRCVRRNGCGTRRWRKRGVCVRRGGKLRLDKLCKPARPDTESDTANRKWKGRLTSK
jgi:hypothetical protein